MRKLWSANNARAPIRGAVARMLVLSAMIVVALAAMVTAAETAVAQQPDSTQGRVVGIASSTRVEAGQPAGEPSVSLLLQTAEGLVTVTLVDGAQASGDDAAVLPTTVPLGALLRAHGRWVGASLFEATMLEVVAETAGD